MTVTTTICSEDHMEVDNPSALELGHLEIADGHLSEDLMARSTVEGGELARDLHKPAPEPTGRGVPEHRRSVVVALCTQR